MSLSKDWFLELKARHAESQAFADEAASRFSLEDLMLIFEAAHFVLKDAGQFTKFAEYADLKNANLMDLLNKLNEFLDE